MKLVKLFQEDDAAPDANRYFWDKVIMLTGLDYNNFKQGKKLHNNDDDWIGYQQDIYVIKYFADDPFWTLYREEEE